MVYRIFVVIVFFSCFSINAFPRDFVDSLETRLILVENSEKLKILDELIPYYFRNEPLQAMRRAKQMFDLAQEEHNVEFQIRARRYKVISNSFLTSYHDEALEDCEKIESDARNKGLINELILINLTFANIYGQVGEYTRSLEFQLQAVHLADSSKVDDLLSVALNRVASTYIELANYERAEQYLKRSLMHAKLHEQKEVIAKINVLFGDMLKSMHNYEYAMEHYSMGFEIYLDLRKDVEIASTLFKIGKCHYHLDKPDVSFQNQLRALSIRNRIKDRTGLAESYNEIGLLCIDNEEYQRAIDNLKLGLNYAETINSKSFIQQSFDYLYQAYHAMEDYENANAYQFKYIAISDLIYSEESERKVKEVETRKEIEIRDQEISSLEKLKSKSEQQLASYRNFLFTLILLLLVIIFSVILFIRSYREKRKINKELQNRNQQITIQNEKLVELNNTKDKFFSIIGHDLKGPLNSLSSFASLLINHTSSLKEEDIRRIAKDLDESLKNLYELLENLLGWASSQTGRIEFKPENFMIMDVLKENVRLLSKAALNKNLNIELKADKDAVVNADINSVKTIVRNLLSNAIKFTPNGGTISLFVEEWKDMVEIGIRDTGVGMSPQDLKKIFDISAKHSTRGTNQEKGTGLGLILCKEFVERNHGDLTVESKPGRGTTFKFTLQKLKKRQVREIEQLQV